MRIKDLMDRCRPWTLLRVACTAGPNFDDDDGDDDESPLPV